MKYTVSIMFEVVAETPREAIARAVEEFMAKIKEPVEHGPITANVVEHTGETH